MKKVTLIRGDGIGPEIVAATREVLSAAKGALDISRARSELGYEPRFDLQKGIEATIAATRAGPPL